MFATLLTFAALLSPSAPDLIPSGVKGVRLHLTVECGDGVRGLCFAHRVTEGETLAQIAERKLGDAARADDIAAMNPGVDVEHLRRNQYLWLPPAVAPLAAEIPRLVYVDMGRAVQGPGPVPFQPGDVAGAVTRNGELLLFVVAMDRAADFERAVRERPELGRPRPTALANLIESGAVTPLRCAIDSAYVQAPDPTVRRTDVFRIERDEKSGALSLMRRSSQAFDDAGKPLGSGDGDGARRGEALLLLLLAGGGLTGLGAVARRRRPVLAAA